MDLFILQNRDGTVGGKPRRSLATQFDNQGNSLLNLTGDNNNYIENIK
jgi:hypothetical protein